MTASLFASLMFLGSLSTVVAAWSACRMIWRRDAVLSVVVGISMASASLDLLIKSLEALV